MNKLTVTALLFLFSSGVMAEISVIVNASNPSVEISHADLKRIFLGKMKKFADGSQILPLMFSEKVPLSNDFSRKITKKSASQFKAYWAKQLFTGKGTPPSKVGTSQEMLDQVKSTSGAIGYVSTADLAPDGVKVVATIP